MWEVSSLTRPHFAARASSRRGGALDYEGRVRSGKNISVFEEEEDEEGSSRQDGGGDAEA